MGPQLFARYADGTGLLADCPSSPTAGSELTQRARMVLEAACARVGWVYRSLEPPGAVRTANLRWLAGYRHPRHQGPSWLRSALAAVFAVPRPLGDGVALAGDPLQVLPALYHACGPGSWWRRSMNRSASRRCSAPAPPAAAAGMPLPWRRARWAR
ncbi:TnsA-like heteromeric transposase endonuclease subunit [Streptomyces dengpaensis]|uniref:TnsA-like heteromeric transposase endonuclease subunit n=1 Tax=Streptomyces dengpaensis TaxID=2049881 RepID=UPI001F0C98E7|nr:TnsA-like heteromeric transposase endonuclease subunit [Streptomyces dengpaensis]